MAHFAEIDEKGIVLRVLVVPDERADYGAQFLSDDLGLGGRWVQTSYSGRHRGRFAGPGMLWDEKLGAFLLPQPFPSWWRDPQGEWHPPVAHPDGEDWVWDEASLAWVKEAL